jgi:hypothetical protein
MYLASSPSWTEYVSAFAAVGGFLVAGVALMIAKASSKSASLSAESAETTAKAAEESARAGVATSQAADAQLAFAREERAEMQADRARRPIVDAIVPSQIDNTQSEVAPARTIRIGFTNSGDRALEDCLLTIMLNRGADSELTNRWGTQTGETRDDTTIEQWPGVNGAAQTFDYFARTMRVPAGVSVVRYVRVGRPGRFSLRVKLFSTELAGNGPWVDAVIQVDSVDYATVNDLANQREPSSGRCSDLDV